MTDQPPSDGRDDEPRRISLPKTISLTLQYLDDMDLEVLQRAVEQELRRRRAEKGRVPGAPAAALSPSKAPQAAAKTGRSQLPMGKASLIKASFQAGVKPQAIARTLRVSLAQVNEVLKPEQQPNSSTPSPAARSHRRSAVRR